MVNRAEGVDAKCLDCLIGREAAQLQNENQSKEQQEQKEEAEWSLKNIYDEIERQRERYGLSR